MTTVLLQQLRAEQELEWFFSRGQIAFERSSFGSALERAELFDVAGYHMPDLRLIYDDDGRVIGQEACVSARPTAEVRAPSGYTPDIDTLTHYAHMSRLLKTVARTSRQAARVLELLYGDLGQRWAPSAPYGRLGALFHLTAKGRQLLDEARAVKGAIDVPDVKRMEVIVTVQCVQPQPARAQALAYCCTQAKVLEQQARNAWLEVKRNEPVSKKWRGRLDESST